ncbi:lipase [Wenyingzhuangia sp. IMCC45574]
MKIKPLQIALFLILILLVLFGFTFLSKKGAIKSAIKSEEGFSFLALKYPTTESFLQLQKDTVATIDKVKAVTNNVVPVQEEEVVAQEQTVKDSLPKTTKKIPLKKVLDFSKIDTTKIERIRYPKEKPNFIKSLKRHFNSNSCRVVHYGDSQLEGDRITSYLRNRMQSLYGGSGPGFIPIKQVYEQVSAVVTPSKNWERYALFDPTKKRFEHKKYGAYLSVSRFTPYVKSALDTISLDSLQNQVATIVISKSKRTYRRFRKFTKIGLHYGNANLPTSIKVYNDSVLIQSDSLITDGKYHQYKIRIATAPENLKIELEAKVSPDFYGVTLDGENGVQIDNVAMRGASGTVFRKADSGSYASMIRALKPKLIIMQYGGNTLPYLKDSTAVDNYGRYMSLQAKWIQKNAKKAQILFIGPTDMATSVNGEMQTYPLLPYLNKVLMKNALDNGIAYWSMYHAMGGKGSMKLWVDERLAGSDYTHFTPKGTKIISELLFTALYLDLKTEHEDDKN